MKNTQSEGDLRQATNGTQWRIHEVAPPIPRCRARSVDACVAAVGLLRPVPQCRLNSVSLVPSSSIQYVLHENAEGRHGHCVLPSLPSGVSALGSRISVSVCGGLNVSAGVADHSLCCQQQASSSVVDDPLQIFGGTPDLLSPAAGNTWVRSGGDRSPDRQDYAQALIFHQMCRRDALDARLKADRQRCMVLKLEKQKQEDLLMRKRQDRGTQFPTGKDLKDITEAVYRLRVQCELTNRRIESLQRRRNGRLGNGEFHSSLEPLGSIGPNATSAVLAPAFSRSILGQVAVGSRPLPRVDPLPTALRSNEAVTDATVDEFGAQWNCVTCTFLNHPLLFTCEQCETPKPVADTNGVAGAASAPTSTKDNASNASTCYCCTGSSSHIQDDRIYVSHRHVQS